MQDDNTEETTLHSSGVIPGIPGIHGPGRVRIDWNTRTVTPLDEPHQADVPSATPENAPLVALNISL